MIMGDVKPDSLIIGVWIILVSIGGGQINFAARWRDGKISLKSTIYKILRLSNDLTAVRKGKIGKRLANKAMAAQCRK
jgi:hypothetical protein